MVSEVDPDIAAALAIAAGQTDVASVTERGDHLGLRNGTNAALRAMISGFPDAPHVHSAVRDIPVSAGKTVPSVWYQRGTETPGPAVVYAHGGGMICGSVEIYEPLIKHYVEATGIPFLAVDYRLAPEFPGSIPAEDVFAAIEWIIDRAEEYGVDPRRVAVMGDSGGGGVAAAATILAREKKIRLARQILIYPMLDDRNTVEDPALAATATWSYDSNFTGWHALLGDELGTSSVSPFSAPARSTDFAGLAPAYIEVGDLDIFRDESLLYAESLRKAGTPCHIDLIPGAPHAHDLIGRASPIGERSMARKLRVIGSI